MAKRTSSGAAPRKPKSGPQAPFAPLTVSSSPSIDIGVLTSFLNSLESYSQDLVQHLRSGQKLCHYTTLGGAIGIIESGDLWLTNSQYSNDDEELRYGHELVDEVIRELEGANKANAKKLTWLNKLREVVAIAR